MPQLEPVIVERKLLVALLATRLTDNLNALKRDIGTYFRPHDAPDVAQVKKIFWDLMAEALALVATADLEKVAKPQQPKGGKG